MTLRDLKAGYANSDTPHDQLDDEALPSSWEAVDLGDAVAGTDIAPPTILARADGLCLLYPGRIHAFQGESESCKSWALVIALAERLNAGENVMMIDFEDDERGVVPRLLAVGVPAQVITDQLTYIRPDEPLYAHNGQPLDGIRALTATLAQHTYTLAAIDGVTEAMVTEGLDLMSNADVATWMRRLPRRIARAGPGVVVADHLTKSKDSQGRYAIGAQHKLSGLTGAAYTFTTLRPFSRARGTTPVEGAVAIAVTKDRPGHVRGWAADGKVGTLELTSWPDGAVSAAIVPPSTQIRPDMIVAGRILGHLAVYDGQSKNQIEGSVEGNAVKIRDALAWMVTETWVRVEPKGRSHLHWLTAAGQAQVPE